MVGGNLSFEDKLYASVLMYNEVYLHISQCVYFLINDNIERNKELLGKDKDKLCAMISDNITKFFEDMKNKGVILFIPKFVFYFYNDDEAHFGADPKSLYTSIVNAPKYMNKGNDLKH